MLNFFFDPKKPIQLNDYETSEYIVNGQVDSYLYKVWDHMIREKPLEQFLTPNAQYHIKVMSCGKLEAITIHKDTNIGRMYVEKGINEEPINEEPISYYQQFYSGGTQFYYDEENRIIKYSTDKKYNDKLYFSDEKTFYYDENNNLQVGSNISQHMSWDHKYEYNITGQIISKTYKTKDDPYYSKTVIEYDVAGRISKYLGYGYIREENIEGETIRRMDKGIQLLLNTDYKYTTSAIGELLCTYETKGLEDIIKSSNEILFDKYGFKKYHKEYNGVGKLRTTYYFDLIYDEMLNWIKIVVSTEYSSGHKTTIKIYEREIKYANPV